MSKRPKLAYHQRTTTNNNNREETSASDVEYEYTGKDHHVPNNVKHVRIHSSITKIEDYAFYNRGSLEEVVLNEGLTVIGEYAFSHFSSLQSIAIPSTVTEINQQAFSSIPSLRDVVLNDRLKKIGNSMFRYCSELQSITIPSTVDEICSSALSYCTNLRDVVLSDGLKKIGSSVFQDCPSLEHITIPSTVTEIGNRAFIDCDRLREVVLHNEEIQIGDKSFKGCVSLERFSFPSLSTRLENIIQAGQRSIETNMDDIPAVEWRNGELIIPTIRQCREIENPWDLMETVVVKVDEEKLDKVIRLIRYYEIKEATTLFELALWKAKIDQVAISNADRGTCRVDVPGPVKDAIMQIYCKQIEAQLSVCGYQVNCWCYSSYPSFRIPKDK